MQHLKKGRFVNLIFTLAIVFFGYGCLVNNDDQQQYERNCSGAELQDLRVHTLATFDDYVFAGTEQGVFRASLSQMDGAQWQCVGLGDREVVAITPVSGNRLLAGIQPKADHDQTATTLYRSAPGGEGWTEWQNGYGGTENFRQINALTTHPADFSTVYARGAGHAARSTDGGSSWKIIYKNWNASGYQAPLIRVDPHHPERIWVGGETSIFSPYLETSPDGGQTWNDRSPSTGGDNAVYSMAFHPEDPEQLMIGIEGSILASNDRGQSWSTNYEHETYPYILTMGTPGGQPSDTVYASGTEAGTSGGDIYVLRTHDFGESWNRTTVKEAGEGQAVNDMLAFRTENGILAYLATQQGVITHWVDG